MKQYIYGRNTVLELLRKQRDITTLYIQKGSKNNEVEDLAKKGHIFWESVDKSVLDKFSENSNHQGVVALIEGYTMYELADLVAQKPKGEFPLLIMLDGLEDPHNLGAILRTSDALNVDGIIIGKHRSVSLTPSVAKVSTGAIEHVKVASVTNLRATLDELKKLGYWIIGADTKKACDYREVNCDMPLVLVIGSEGKGISRLVLEACDYRVSLPMLGHVTSLNASVASAVLLYQIHNKRYPLNKGK